MRVLLALLIALIPAAASAQFRNGSSIGSAYGFSGGSGSSAPTYLVAPAFLLQGQNSGTATSNYGFGPFASNGGVSSSTESLAEVPISTAGTISNLSGTIGSTFTAGSDNAFTIYKNTSATAATIDINAASTVFSDTTHTITTAAAGSGGTGGTGCDSLAIHMVPSTSPAWASTQIYISALFTSTVGQEAPLFAGSSGNMVSGDYVGVGMFVAPNATEGLVSARMPVAGTLKNMCFQTTAAPGSGKSWTATIYHDTQTTAPCDTSAASAGPLAATVSNTATQGMDLTSGHAEHFNAGDCVSILFTGSGTPAAAQGRIGITFVPDTTNQYPLMVAGVGAIPTGNGYFTTQSGAVSAMSTETVSLALVPPLPSTFKAQGGYFSTTTAPGGVATRTASFRQGTIGSLVSGNPACTIGSAVVDGTCSGTQTLTAGNVIDWGLTVSGTPAASTGFKQSWWFGP